MQLNRRQIMAGALGAAAHPALAAKTSYKSKPSTGPSMDDLARVAALPVLQRDRFTTPVIIQSIELLRIDKEYFVRIRSTDGAEGMSVCNPPRADYLDRMLGGQFDAVERFAISPAMRERGCAEIGRAHV